MDDDLLDVVEHTLGVRPTALSPLSGGCVGEVYRATVPGDDVVVKVDRRGSGGSLDIEGRMLIALRERSELPVPSVLHAEPGVLVIEHIENDGRRSDEGEAEAGRMLAGLHGVISDRYGFNEDTLIGGLPQPNAWSASWTEFFAEHRIRRFARDAERAGALPRGGLSVLFDLADAMDRVVGLCAAPGLVHGDVWSGNVLWDKGRVVAFIDPAAHYAEPEVELAFIELFSCFGAAFWHAYSEVRPRREGWARRRAAYQVSPLLVHAVLFGGSYGASAVGRARDALA
ncbi:MAG: fructosamine kinase family protein [Planctomycetota bacterium]